MEPKTHQRQTHAVFWWRYFDPYRHILHFAKRDWAACSARTELSCFTSQGFDDGVGCFLVGGFCSLQNWEARFGGTFPRVFGQLAGGHGALSGFPDVDRLAVDESRAPFSAPLFCGSEANVTSWNVSEWKVNHITFCGQGPFPSEAALMKAYNEGSDATCAVGCGAKGRLQSIKRSWAGLRFGTQKCLGLPNHESEKSA